jgi:hypothetical protein
MTGPCAQPAIHQWQILFSEVELSLEGFYFVTVDQVSFK